MVNFARGSTDFIMRNHFLYYLFGNSFIQGINFLVLPIIGRHFSPSEYAIVPLLEVYLMIFSWITSMMLLSALDRYYFDERYDRREVLDTILTFLLSSGLGAFAAIYIILNCFESLAQYRYLALVATFQQVLLQLYLFPMEKLKLEKKAVKFIAFGMVKSGTYLVIIAFFVIWLERDIAAIYEAQVIALILLLLLFSRYDIGLRTFRLRISLPILRVLLSFSAPLILAGLGMYIIESSSRVFILYYVGEEALGNFSFIYKIVNALSVLLLMPSTCVWTPYVFSNLSKEELIKQSMTKVVVLLNSAALFIVITLLANYYSIIEFMSRGKFHIPIQIFGVLSVGYVFYCLLAVLAPGFHIREKTRLLVGYFLLGGAANIVLNWLLIPKWQLLGAALSSFLSFFIIFMLYAINLQRIFAIKYAWRQLAILWFSFCTFSVAIIGADSHVYDNIFVIIFLIVIGFIQGSAWLTRQGKGLIMRLFSMYNMYVLVPQKILPEPRVDFQFKILGMDDVQAICEFSRERIAGYEEKAIARLQNHTCYRGLAFVEDKTGKIVYLCWIAFKPILVSELQRTLTFNQKTVYFFDEFTLLEYRSRGLHSSMMVRRINYCLQQHKSKVIILIETFNRYPIRTVWKVGFKWQKTFIRYRSGAFTRELKELQQRIRLLRSNYINGVNGEKG